MQRRIFFSFRVCVGILLLYAVFKIVPYKSLLPLFKKISYLYIFLGLFSILSLHLVAGLRWYFILKILKIKVSLKEAIYAFFSSLFFNLFFPSLIASDIFRSVALISRYSKGEKILASVIIDRFSGIVALTFLVLGSFILGKDFLKEKEILLGIGLLIITSSLFLFFLYSFYPFKLINKLFKRKQKFLEKINNLYKDLNFFRKNPFAFFKIVTAYSFPIQVLNIFSFFFTLQAFGEKISLIGFFITVPFIILIATLPVTVAGIGTRELACIYFFSKIGIEKNMALALSLFNLFFMISVAILGGLIYVMVYYRWLESAKKY